MSRQTTPMGNFGRAMFGMKPAPASAPERGWHPSPSRGSRVEPTVPELLSMADGTRQDWRPTEPTRNDMRDIEREYLPRHLDAVTYLEKQRRHARPGGVVEEVINEDLADHWDAIAHLATGT